MNPHLKLGLEVIGVIAIVGVAFLIIQRMPPPFEPPLPDDTEDPLDDLPQNESDVLEIYRRFISYNEIVQKLENLSLQYPGYAELLNLNLIYNLSEIPGLSQNYSLYVLRITNESLGLHKPEVFFQAGIHGDEWTGPSSYTWFADWFLSNAVGYTVANKTQYRDRESLYLQYLLNHREIYIMPCFNPDGFDRNRRYDYTDRDLNRNFDMDVATEPLATINGQLLAAFINSHQFRIGIGAHDGTHLVCYPMDSTHAGAHARTKAGLAAYPQNPLDRIGLEQSYCPPDYFYYDFMLANMINYTGNTP